MGGERERKREREREEERESEESMRDINTGRERVSGERNRVHREK